MPSVLLSYLCLAASMSLVGVYVGMSKPLVTIFPVMLLTWFRYSIAIPPMLGWFKRAPGEKPLDKRTHTLMALSSFIGSFLFTLCALMGIKLTSALSAGIIMAGLPAAVALLSRIFLKEHISKRTMLAIGCSVLGIAFLAIANILFAPTPAQNTQANTFASLWQPLLGHLLLIASIFCEATYVVIGKTLSSRVSAKRISALLNLWGWIFSAPMGIYLFIQFDFAPVELKHWALLIFYSLCASVFTVWAWMTGLKNIPASSAGIFTTMLPISASIVGIFLGEHFGIMHGVAFLLVVFGIVLATWPTSKKQDKKGRSTPKKGISKI